MDYEAVREYALSISPSVTEDLFVENWVTWRVGGKWFLLMQLDAPEPRVAVKLSPEQGVAMREKYAGVQPAYHMNKRHWNDLYLSRDLPDEMIQELISESYSLVLKSLPKRVREGMLDVRC